MSDHTSGSDNNVIPYGNPGKDLHPGTEPDVITNRYRFIENEPAISLISDQWVAGGMEAATRAD